MDNLPTKFVNQPSHSLFCPLCEKLLRDPVISIRCGHTFCRKCLVNTRTTPDCPVDKKSIDINSIVPNKAVEGQLEDLLIFCRHSLRREDSDDEFQVDEDGCKEHITLGRRNEHEDHCMSALVPCPNSSNHCGLFRKRDFNDHLMVCQHQPCKFSAKGCNFTGNLEQMTTHMDVCTFASNDVAWELLEAIDGEADGLQSKYMVKVIRNLNERVKVLEGGKDEMLAGIEKCNNNIVNLSIQVEKLAQAVSQIQFTQNAMIKDRYGGSQSVSDLGALADSRKAASIYGLNMYGSSRTRSQSGCLGNLFDFTEQKHESWKMPLSFKCVGTFRGHAGVIRAISPRGPYLFSGGADHTIKVWDIKDKDMKNSRGCLATLSGHSGDIHALCTTGGFLYSAGTDKSIKVWNIENIQLHMSREDAHSDVIAALVTTGSYIFSGSYSSIKITANGNGFIPAQFRLSIMDSSPCLDIIPLMIWTVVSLELVKNIGQIHHWVRAIAVDPRKKKVYSGSHNTVHIWEADQPFSSLGNLNHTHGSVYSIAVTNKYLIIGTYNQNTHLYDVNTHQYVKVLNGHLGIINDLVTSPSGNFLFTASFDNTIQLWDMVKLLPIQVFSRHEGSVNCVALRGDKLFTGSDDKEIKVYLYYQGLASKNLMVV